LIEKYELIALLKFVVWTLLMVDFAFIDLTRGKIIIIKYNKRKEKDIILSKAQ
jgi:hypothetical protein